MNKATFSRLVKDNTYISDADVLALEQVVQAFPYCHTAHMLLAKAASDKGSMLAPQRLRKAAIHAPSRAVLKQLIEGKLSYQSAENALSRATDNQLQLSYNEEIEDLIENDLPTQNSAPQHAATTPQAEIEEASVQQQVVSSEEQAPAPVATPTLAETEEEVTIAEAIPEEPIPQTSEPETIAEEEHPDTTLAAAELPGQDAIPAGSEEQETLSQQEEVLTVAATPAMEPVTELAISQAAEPEPDTTPETAGSETTEPEVERPPQAIAEVEAEEPATAETVTEETEAKPQKPAASDEEPDLTETAPQEAVPQEAEVPHAETTEAEEEEITAELTPANQPETALAPEPEQEPTPAEPTYSDSLIFSIFRDSELGYAMSSSRMGESLQPKGELTREVPFHFQPELLVEYQLAKYSHTPAPEAKPEKPPQQDLIDDFLKQAAKSKTRAKVVPKAEEQEDLSSKSTRLNKSIVSENLAQIFAMQGKTKKAIKIYQQLQLKMPEKKDYFAVQINKLQNHSS